MKKEENKKESLKVSQDLSVNKSEKKNIFHTLKCRRARKKSKEKKIFPPTNELCGSKISSFNQITTLNRNNAHGF